MLVRVPRVMEGPSEQARCGSAGNLGGLLHCWAPQGHRNACHWESNCVHGSGQACVLPAGGWSGLDMLDEHVKRADIVVTRVMAWH